MAVSAVISIANGMESGMKLFGMKAGVYATVAWAFGDRVPPPPADALANVRRHHANSPEFFVNGYRNAWSKAATQVVTEMESRLAAKGIRPQDWKKVLQGACKDSRRDLALMLWDAGEKNVSSMGSDLAMYRGMRKSIDYPN